MCTGSMKLTHEMKYFVCRNIIREWRNLGRHLLMGTCDFMEIEAIISNIDHSHRQTQEKCYQLLMKWEEMNSSSATAEAVVIALRSMQNNLIASQLERMILTSRTVQRGTCGENCIRPCDGRTCQAKVKG